MSRRWWIALWLLLTIVCTFTCMAPVSHNNYLIFKGEFFHFINQLDLYCTYPAEHGDTNHYGPLFALIIAPFAILPDMVGMPLWNIAMTTCLCWAIHTSVFDKKTQKYLYAMGALPLYTAVSMQQFNIAIAAIMIAAFSLVERGKDRWATLLIMVARFCETIYHGRHRLRSFLQP